MASTSVSQNDSYHGLSHQESLAAFNVTKDQYFAARPDLEFTHIATSALVVVPTGEDQKPHILLLQRAAHDSNPHKWEPPGGACDDEDESILYGAARELREETGFTAVHIQHMIEPSHFFSARSGRKICRFNLVVRIKEVSVDGKPSVPLLDPNEHQNYVWATEDEVRAGRAGSIDLDFTRNEVKQTVLKALSTFALTPVERTRFSDSVD